MAAYVLRRLLYAVPILFGIVLVTFLLFHVVAEDPALAKVGKRASPEKIAEARREMGTDKPLFWAWDSQFVRFLTEVATLDFGRSWHTKQTVGSMIARGMGPSLSLAVPAFLLEISLAVSLALVCAFRRNSPADVTIVVLAVAGISIPSLAYIIFGQYYLAYEWKLFPVFGYEASLRGAAFLALPILIWVLLTIGSEVRFYRAVMLEEMRQDYVRTAAAKGLPTHRILFRHILRNAGVQIVTRAVIVVPFLILGSLLIEVFFGIPGLGSMTVDALHREDFPVVKAMVVFGAILYIVFSLLTDVLYAVVDPRIRLR